MNNETHSEYIARMDSERRRSSVMDLLDLLELFGINNAEYVTGRGIVNFEMDHR